eukprot:m.53063 g.53063  ORF g.53063 m.53063 type:complete len:171 (+) comp13124_c0_seq1:134-646(+)
MTEVLANSSSRLAGPALDEPTPLEQAEVGDGSGLILTQGQFLRVRETVYGRPVQCFAEICRMWQRPSGERLLEARLYIRPADTRLGPSPKFGKAEVLASWRQVVKEFSDLRDWLDPADARPLTILNYNEFCRHKAERKRLGISVEDHNNEDAEVFFCRRGFRDTNDWNWR